MLPINLLSVLVAAVVAFILGFLFHGPVLGKVWMKLANVHMTGNEKFADMVYVLAAMYLFASNSPYLSGPGAWTGVVVALWVWVGFLVTSSSIDVIWMNKSYSLWLFEGACSLVVMVAMGAIIGAW
jgi:hypothetical protein